MRTNIILRKLHPGTLVLLSFLAAILIGMVLLVAGTGPMTCSGEQEPVQQQKSNGLDYSRYQVSLNNAQIETRDGRRRLRRGVDRGKDQSYVLFGLSRDVLKRVLLPITMCVVKGKKGFVDVASITGAQARKSSSDLASFPAIFLWILNNSKKTFTGSSSTSPPP